MQKCDLHQDLICSFADDLDTFGTQDTNDTENENAYGGLPDYERADLQLVVANIWPYRIENQTAISDKDKGNLYWQQYEQLRETYDINLITSAPQLIGTKYVDFQFNLIYQLKGGDHITSTDDIDLLYDQGYRSIQFVAEQDNNLAHCYTHTGEGRLTDLGKDIITYMDQKGMMVDTANMNHASMMDAYRFTKKPIMNSHTNIQSLRNHSRNVTDDFLDMVAQGEGVIGLSLEATCMGEPSQVTIADYIQQITYVRNIVGDDHIAFGSGFHTMMYNQEIRGYHTVGNITKLANEIVNTFGNKFAEKFFRENAYRLFVQTLPQNMGKSN